MLIRIVKAVMIANIAITAVKLSGERGGRFLFTMIAFVLILAAAPYLASIAVMRRVAPGWALAIAIGAGAFGLIDAAVRYRAFFVEASTLGGRMALYMPLYAVLAIPFFALIARTCLNVVARSRTALPPPD